MTSNNWIGSAGAGGIDLRSDTMTTPTAAMLTAIQNTTLLDDVYHEDPTTVALQDHCAQLTGKEAAILVLSGTMGNQVALRALLTQPPHSVLCDRRSHIFQYEGGGTSSLTGAMIIPVLPKNGLYLTLEEVQENAVISDDIHACPTRVISLENTLNGVVMPLAETRRISDWARSKGIRVHCDGARLWEAAAAQGQHGAGSLLEYAACFDTISMCFSKGLGAPIGSIIVGSRDVIQQCFRIRKALGGGLRQSGVISAAARVSVDETFGGKDGLLKASHGLAAEVAQMWTDRGGKMRYPVHTNMAWLDFAASGVDGDRFVALAAAEGLKMYAERLIVHYQIYQNRAHVVPRLERVFSQVLQEAAAGGKTGEASGKESVYPTAK